MVKERMLKNPPREVSRAENRGRYEALLAYSTAYSQHHIARTWDAASHFYGGNDPLRRREVGDGGMVREDRNAMANLPTQAIHSEYPDRFASNLSPFIDGTILE